jgi:prevent-host-death family protein
MAERVISATEARVHFGEVMRRVAETNEAVIVERGGEPQVVILSMDEYGALLRRRPDKPEWETKLEAAQRLLEEQLDGRRLPPVDEIIHAMREERDAQLDEALR